MQEKNYRIEADAFGEIKVDNRFYWGATTQRSLEYFKIGTQKMPIKLIQALAIVKQSAAIVNLEFGDLSNEIAKSIIDVTVKILNGTLDDNFPLSVWQTGSGTHTNMNMNEVIAGIANEQLTDSRGGKSPVHPYDHVNLAQSTNDSFSSAMNIATVIAINEDLIPALINLHSELNAKVKAWDKHIKIGRTHLQDAVPITLGQEFSAYVAQIYYSIQRVESSLKGIYFLAQGATAVGTGLNCKLGFAEKFVNQVTLHTGYQFKTALNKFEAIASHDGLVELSSTLNTVAVSIMKIANDIKLLGSGPRCGFGELNLPENELGSSMMPGKINPAQIEAITMVCTQVMGNNLSVTIAGSNGQLELNVFKPVIIHNILQSIELLSSSIDSFVKHCIVQLEPNLQNINYLKNQSLMLVTALNKHIGYDNATKIARKAQKEGKTIKQTAIELKFLSEDEFDKLVIIENMV